MKLARIVDGVIAEFPQPAEGFSLEESFHRDFLAALVSVPNSTQKGWVEQNGSFVAPSAPETVPPVLLAITRRQLRLTLLAHLLLSEVEPAIAALDEPERSVAMIEWQDASEFRRDHPLIAQIGSALGLAEADVNAMWAEAMAR